MIRYVSIAALLAVLAGCQQSRPPPTAGMPAIQGSQAAPRAQQREAFLADVERRVAFARRQPGATPDMVREMEEMLQTLRRSPNPELLLGAMLAGASPNAQDAEPTPTDLYRQAAAAEQLGLKQDALVLYRRSAQGGNALSAARLRELEAVSAPAVAPSASANSAPLNVARLLSAGPLPPGSANGNSTGPSTAEEVFTRAAAFEQENRLEQALTLYVDSSQRGHGPASRRLMELFAYGAPGLPRDYVVAVKYKELALRQGIQIEVLPRR